MKNSLSIIMDNDNEIGSIYRKDREYIIEINIWNGTIKRLKTVNCKKLIHNIQLVDEFGEIVINDNNYKFMTVYDNEIILEIEADDIVFENKN